jgi:hypothetical protein
MLSTPFDSDTNLSLVHPGNKVKLGSATLFTELELVPALANPSCTPDSRADM